jgi:beta-glucoside PTS system EIICBA component
MDHQSAKNQDRNEESILNKILDVIGGSFTPIIGVLAGSGLLSALVAVLTMLGWVSKESGTYAILSAAGHAVFYFLPIFLGITLSLKLGANGYVGGTIGAALLEPHFSGLLSEGVEQIEFFGLPVVLMSYSSTVFPIFIAVSIYAALNKLLKKTIYKDIQMFINPLISLVVIVPLTVLIFGPIGMYVGQVIGDGIEFLSSRSGLLTGAVLGAAWTFLTLLGLHWAIIPIAIANLAHGPDPIIGMAAAAPFAQIGMALGVLLKTKDRDLKTLAGTSILPGALAGTTEIINYGILLRYKRTMIYVAVAGAVGGAMNGAMGVRMAVFSLPSFLSIPAFTPIGSYLLGTLTAFTLAGLLTYMLGFDDKRNSMLPYKIGLVHVERETIASPLSGKLIPLIQFSDPLFASGTIGQGVTIEPAKGEVYSPADGIVTTLFPTKHAIGVTSEGGAEILIFIGVDTRKLNGEYFISHVNQDDKVRRGDLLLEFDIQRMKESGYSVTTPVVITNSNQYLDVKIEKNESINEKEDLITVIV